MSLLNAKRYPLNVSSGFTLIELLVVIAIIGILSSVVLASLNTARLKARDTRRVSDIKSIQLAMEFYYDSLGYYPLSIGTLVGSGNGQSLAAEPKDPQTGVGYTLYGYKLLPGSTTKATAYHVGATLEQVPGATTLKDGDIDNVTSAVAGWTSGFDGSDGTVVVYDVSNIKVP